MGLVHERVRCDYPSAMSLNDAVILHLRRTLFGSAEIPITADSVCHIAGFPIGIGDVTRQLCAWCGEILTTAHRTNESGFGQAEFPAKQREDLYQVGSFVRANSGGRAVVGIVWTDQIPTDACCATRSQRHDEKTHDA